MLHPHSRNLAMAPIEDEEIGEEEERAVAEAKEWLKHNKPIPHEEVLAGFSVPLWTTSASWANHHCRRAEAEAKFRWIDTMELFHKFGDEWSEHLVERDQPGRSS